MPARFKVGIVGAGENARDHGRACRNVEQAELELEKARADHQALLASIADRRLTARARLIDFKAAYDEIQLRLDAETNLLQKQTISEVAYRRTQIRTEQALDNLNIENRERMNWRACWLRRYLRARPDLQPRNWNCTWPSKTWNH